MMSVAPSARHVLSAPASFGRSDRLPDSTSAPSADPTACRTRPRLLRPIRPLAGLDLGSVRQWSDSIHAELKGHAAPRNICCVDLGSFGRSDRLPDSTSALSASGPNLAAIGELIGGVFGGFTKSVSS
jgi:hypothetical protein